ncbi:hypothetical protein ACTMU2_15360 [Cupriavidus basilensis]
MRWPVSHPQLGEIGLVGQPYRTSRYVAELVRVAPMPGETHLGGLARGWAHRRTDPQTKGKPCHLIP